MKTQIRTLFVTMIALGMSAGQTHAGDEAIAAIGGFLAGIITGVAIEDHDRQHHGSYHYSGSRCHKHGRHGCSSCYGHHKSGHWEVRHVKVYVPGHWEYVRNRCGDRVRVWKSGYYTTRPEKVWVTYSGRGRYGSYCD